MESPVKYARSGDVYIAYRVFGDGPRDIVLIPGTISHVELLWEVPSNEHLLKRLTAFARVIVFDKRGQGLSDRVAEQTLEERVGDVRAVMDAAGSERATIYGWSEGGPMCLMFSATYPSRTSALVLFGTYASMQGEPLSVSREAFERFLGDLDAHWGEGALLRRNAPSRRSDPAFLQWYSRIERAAASPGSLRALMTANFEIDVRHLLPAIQVPTLILHRAGDELVRVASGRYLAERIPGAKYVELPGTDHMVTDRETQDVIADEIEEFITGTRRRLEPDRVLATVMFTDIVRSTERAAELGDARWRELLGNYYAVLRKELSAFRGHEISTAGDGLLATFDGPARGIRCACAVREKMRPLGLQVRTGLHTGECERIGDDIGGIAVHIAARVAAVAGQDEVVVSGTVKDLVAGSGLKFVDRGAHNLKGVPGEWRLFAVQ
ncbi:MAG TPA: adenylate/guanylate cyclase domain-containing protein [Candidatus Cybelea sp.]|nr:adenylate/guanylate cyclase domain-containing protein [Candidatus Cybelea sp.]